jgi:hypothetical protein
MIFISLAIPVLPPRSTALIGLMPLSSAVYSDVAEEALTMPDQRDIYPISRRQ